MEFKIGDKKFVVKDRLTGLDFMNIFPLKSNKPMDLFIALGVEALISPKLKAEDIENFDLSDFLAFLMKIKEIFNLEKLQDFLASL